MQLQTISQFLRMSVIVYKYNRPMHTYVCNVTTKIVHSTQPQAGSIHRTAEGAL